MSAAAGALMLAAPGAALAGPDGCTITGTAPNQTATCTGNQSGGIAGGPDFSTSNVSTLRVENLTGPIAPVNPVIGVRADGIYFVRSGYSDLSVISSADITVTGGYGTGANSGILVGTQRGNILVDSTGTITSEKGFGINAARGNNPFGKIEVINDGEIDAFLQGIDAKNAAGRVVIDSTGNIRSRRESGIRAVADYFTGAVSGARVDITNNGNITAATFGIDAFAVGAVEIETTGDITSGTGQGSTGNDGHGIRATTFAPRSGSGSIVNDITITNTGNIKAAARGSGIYAKSGYSDDASITVNHVSGTITGGDGDFDGSAVTVFSTVKSDAPVDGTVTATVTTSGALKGGGTGGAGIDLRMYSYVAGAKIDGRVVITKTGSVEGGSGIGGTAIRSDAYGCGSVSGDCQAKASASADVTVENSGAVTGSIRLSYTGVNIFDNKSGGLFNMGSVVYLGTDGDELRSAGILSPGGKDAVATVKVTGNVVQQAGGTMLIDVDGGTNTADHINVTGTASLAGTVAVNVINPVSTDQQFIILSAAGGVTNSGLTLAGGLPIGFSLLYPNANDLVLGVTVDFSLDEGDLNRNQTRLAENLNAIIDAGAGGVAPVTNALLGITNLEQYRDALNELLPEHYLNLQAATLFSAEDFAQSLMSCREREGAYAVIAEGQCLWVEADANRLDQDGTDEQVDTAEDSYRFAAGGQFGFADNLHMGLALRYETLEQDTGDFAESDGQRFHAGAAIKYNEGPVLLAGAVSAGRTWYDTERHFGFGGFADSASSSHQVDYLNGLLRAAYLMPLGDFYLKPIADLNVTHLRSDGFTEDDGGGAALKVEGEDGTYVSLSPALEAGAEWRLASGTLLRPFIGGGVTWYGDNAFTGSASFADGPEDAGSFETRTEIDEVMANVAAGIDILGAGGFDFRLRYEGAFGETVTSQSLALRAAMKF